MRPGKTLTEALTACITATFALSLFIIPDDSFAQLRRTKPPSTAASATANKPERRTTQSAYLKLTSPRQQRANASVRNERGRSGRSATGDVMAGGNRRNGVRLTGNVATSWTALNSASGAVSPQRSERQLASRNGRRVTFAAYLPRNRPESAASEVQPRTRRNPQTGALIEGSGPTSNPPPRQ